MLEENIINSCPQDQKKIQENLKKMAKTLVVSKIKVYMDISMLAGTAKCRKGRVSPLWMNQIQDCFFREDISRAVPGKQCQLLSNNTRQSIF